MWKDLLEHKKEQEEIESKAVSVNRKGKRELRNKKSTEIMRMNSEI